VIAVDTNVIVRLIVDDDPAQVAAALALAAREPFFVSLTVLAETEWVLRSRFDYDRAGICTALGVLPQLVDVRFEDAIGVAWALKRFAIAGELADYLHIVAARGIARFATFEKRLPRRAGNDSPAEIDVLR